MSKTASKSSKTTVRPLGDKILVKRDEAASKTESGIFLPENARREGRVIFGTVKAVGNGTLDKTTGQRIPLELKTGDRILFSKPYEPNVVKMEDDELWIIENAEVVAVID
jgi:chaperonin GroES